MRRFGLALSVVLLTGCFPSTGNIVGMAVDRTVDRAADRVGDQIGQAIAARMLANNPALMYAYSMSVFSMMFHHGGYWYQGFDSYKEGQFTRWNVKGTAEGSIYERSLIRQNEDTSEWWRVETRTPTDQGEDVVIMEALLGSADDIGNRKVLRMRALLPGESEPNEIPIEEQDSENWKIQTGRRLTAESMEGMTKGQETVTTPAGTFETTLLQTKSGHTVSWWTTQKVPGGLVRYNAVNENGDVAYVWELTAFGNENNTSVLGSF